MDIEREREGERDGVRKREKVSEDLDNGCVCGCQFLREKVKKFSKL